MGSEFAIGMFVGFAMGAILVAGVFYALYLQVSTELFEHMSQIKKTLGWLNIRIKSELGKHDVG